MVSPTRILVLICAALWLITKVVLLQFVPFETNVQAGVMLNLFFILLIGVFAIRRVTRHRRSDFIDSVKAVAKATSMYVLAAVFALAVFNYAIAADTIQLKYEADRKELQKVLQDGNNLAEIRANNPEAKKMTDEEIRSRSLESFDQRNEFLVTRWYFALTLSFFALMIAAVFYSLVLTILWRAFMM